MTLNARQTNLVARVMAVAVVAAFALFVGAVVQATQSNRDDAQSAAAVAAQIQAERRRAAREDCVETNRRYHDTIATLDRLIEEAPPERKQRARESRASTVLLIEAMLPKRNCDLHVRRRAPTRPPN
jgi:hypothetical protein